MTEEEREDIMPVDEGETTPKPAETDVPEGVKPEAAEAAATDTAEAYCEEDDIACLKARLAEAEQKMAEYLDGWQRSQATFANFRRRTEAEQASFRSVANAALLTRLLSVADDFARAFQVVPENVAGQAWLDGIALIRRKVEGILEAENVKPIELEPGDAFDPMYHQAVLYQEVEGFEEGQIVAEVERGYMLSDRVLRPSSVVVAKAPAKPAEPEPAIDVEGGVVSETPVGEKDVAPAAPAACCEGESDTCCEGESDTCCEDKSDACCCSGEA